MSAVAAALVEAWGEVRVHRLRFVLSLVGVFLAVFAMTTITALGDMARQLVVESVERSGGRAATFQAQVFGGVDGPPDPAEVDAQFAALVERYDVDWSSVSTFTGVVAAFPEGTRIVNAQLVEPDYAQMHRIVPLQGRWFADTDADLYAPAVVVNRTMLTALGPIDPARPPTVLLGDESPVLATVIGVLDDPGFEPQLFLLPQAYARWFGPDEADLGGSSPTLELWVPEADADAVQQAVQSDLSAVFGPDAVSVFRSDAAGELQVLDLVLTYGVRIVGGFALLLGGVGVLNVGLVTVRQRIREIGVRRSFGATSGRVFTTVLLESVCATAAAGALAVALSVVLVENIPFELLPGDLLLTQVPPFPVRAAVEGFAAATLVGALAGFLPALIAVRAKVIDAIRY